MNTSKSFFWTLCFACLCQLELGSLAGARKATVFKIVHVIVTLTTNGTMIVIMVGVVVVIVRKKGDVLNDADTVEWVLQYNRMQ